MTHRIATKFGLVALLLTVPMMAHSQAVATICKDASTSAASGRGACSGHGGVDAKATSAAKKAAAKADKAAKSAAKTAAKAEAKKERKSEPVPNSTVTRPTPTPRPAPTPMRDTRADNNDSRDAMAECKDGTYSRAATHRGACSRHGGVAKFLKPME